MSNSQLGNPQVGQANDFIKVFKELIPVRCSVKDCNQNQEIYSIPVQLDDLNPPKKAIIFVCPEHNKKQNETRISYSFLQNQIVKQLRIVKFEDRDLQLYKANQKLQQNACCMRENAKTANLEIILTKLQLLSQDDNIIFQLVKRLYTQQVIFYMKLLKDKTRFQQSIGNSTFEAFVERIEKIITIEVGKLNRFICNPTANQQGIALASNWTKLSFKLLLKQRLKYYQKMSTIYISGTLEYGIDAAPLEQYGPKLMKIQCLVKECYDAPTVSLVAQKNDKKFIQFLCQSHFSIYRSKQINELQFRMDCEITNDENPRNLKQNKIPDLYQAIKTLDKYSCCMRENIKYQNIKILYTIFTLVSNDIIQLQELLQRQLKEKYYRYLEVKQYIDKIKNGQKQLNPLEAFIQLQILDNVAKNKKEEDNIQASDQINQILSSIRLSKIQKLDN
ncbi:hypothetical protein pb186bvf_019004 [Paramecium bursaria]